MLLALASTLPKSIYLSDSPVPKELKLILIFLKGLPDFTYSIFSPFNPECKLIALESLLPFNKRPVTPDLLNAEVITVFTVDGIVISPVNEVSFIKACWPIYSKPSFNSTLLKFLFAPKANLSICFTVEGSLIVVSELAEKAPWSIVLTPSGITTDVSFFLPKAPLPIVVTAFPLIFSGITTSVSVPLYFLIVPLLASKSKSFSRVASCFCGTSLAYMFTGAYPITIANINSHEIILLFFILSSFYFDNCCINNRIFQPIKAVKTLPFRYTLL